MVKKELKTKYVHLSLEDGILVGVYGEGLEITRTIAEDIVKSRLTFIDGKCYPTLADITQVAGTSKGARDYFSTKEATTGLTAGALLVNSSFGTLIGNFFLTIAFSKKIPTRLFTDKVSAIKWLEKHKEN